MARPCVAGRRLLDRLQRRLDARGDRGAIIPMVAMLLVVLIPSSALAVDLGMQRVVRRDMQALSDVVALDLVRLVDGRNAAQINSGYHGSPTLAAALAKSVARNGGVLGDAPQVVAKLAFMDPTTHRLETVVGPGGQPVTREATGAEIPTAVEVTSVGGVDFAFAPGHGGAVRTSIAVPAPSTCFRLGSFAVGLNPADAPLIAALMPGLVNSSTLNVMAVGYTGLAALQMDLLDLVEVGSLGVGTPDELLELDGLTLAGFYAAAASAVQGNGGPTASVDVLHQLSTSANVAGTFALRELLGIATADTAALSARFNVLDLVVGAAQVANGTNFLDVSGSLQSLAGVLPGVGTARLQVTEGPKLACGPKNVARAQTAQVRLEMTANKLAAVNLPLAGFLAQAVVDTTLSTTAQLAKAEAVLTDLRCGDATSASNAEGIDLAVTAALSQVSSSGNMSIAANVNVPLVGQVAVHLTVPLTASASASATPTTTVAFRHPPDAYGVPKSFGSNWVLNQLTAPSVASLNANVTVTTILGTTTMSLNSPALAVLRGALQTVVTTATSTANTATSHFNSQVLDPLADQLGVKLGGADVFALTRPSCNDPALAG